MQINIVKNRNIWFLFSGTLIVGSILSFIFIGLNFGIDFAGGTLLEIKSNQGSLTNQTINDVFKGFEEIKTVSIQQSGENQFMVRFKYIENETRVKLDNAFKEKIKGYEELRYETIGPIIGQDLKEKSVIALLIASLLIIIYIAFVFRKLPNHISSWKFGVTAVLALAHDLIITVGAFSFLSYFIDIEIDSLFVTALLTIMGWSVNDTIIIFDRIRENLIKDRRRTFAETADISINETLGRSINTSLTILITLFALFFLAGSSIKFFVLALIIGISIGTYSSIFLATPILIVWNATTLYVADNRKRLNADEDNSAESIQISKKKLIRKKRR